jgi:hypothetical protein
MPWLMIVLIKTYQYVNTGTGKQGCRISIKDEGALIISLCQSIYWTKLQVHARFCQISH